MKAVVFTGKGRLDVVERETPKAIRDMVLVKVTAAGICGTDIELLLPSEEPVPFIPGHEVAGVVEAVDEEHGFKAGDRVVVNCHVTCGSCEHCKAGDLIFCPELKAIGFDLDGGDAEYVLVPAASLRHLPDDIPDELAVIASDALGTPWNAVQKADPGPGKTIAVFGAGPIGHMAVICLKHTGATVIAVDINQERLESAAAFGADYIVNSADEDAAEALRRLTAGKGVDAAIQGTGSKAAFHAALDSLCYRGTMVQMGVCREVTINPHVQINDREIIIKGTRNFNDHDLDKLFSFIRENEQIKEVVTHRFPLERAREAFDTAISGKGLKVILVPSAMPPRQSS